MNTGLAIRSTVTLLAVGSVVYILFLVEAGEFPFDSRTVDAHTLVIEPGSDSALPADLQAGDRIDLREQDLRTRAALFMDTLPGELYVLQVQRNGRSLEVTVTKDSRKGTDFTVFYATVFPLVLVLGLTTLWWGRDWTAWGLSLFAFGTILNVLLFTLPLPPVAGFIAVLLNQSVVSPLLAVGLYVSALALSGPALSARLRRWFHLGFGFAVLATAVLIGTQTVGYIVFGNAMLEERGVAGLLFAVLILIPLAVLLTALRRADPARRLRLRWIIVSLGLFIGAIAWGNLDEFSDLLSTQGVLRRTIWWCMVLSGLTGILYSVLRKRVVAMSFAINRALVYGLIAALVIGVFAVLAAVIENTAIGRDAGLALTVAVSVAVGFVLEALRDRITDLVERLFFRRTFEAEAALRQFAQQCVYIERPDRLLDEAEEEIHRHMQPESSAFYDRGENGYVRIRQRGEGSYPERIDADDRAFVSMRADREPVNLRDVRSALGSEGFAFPMAVRGVLGGALVCGQRTEEYTRDERKLLAELAQQVGTALHALRARDNEALVRAMASGEIDLPTARMRPRAVQASQ